MAQELFAALLSSTADELGIDARYFGSTISELESGKRRMSLDDARVVGAVDPLRRGAGWVAFGLDTIENRPAVAEPPAKHKRGGGSA